MAASIIPVPIGKGIDRASDEYLIPPPSTYVAQNVRLTKRGAYEKRPGATFETTLGANSHGFVTAVREGRNAEEIVCYGNRGGTVYSEDSTRTIPFGSLVPTEVRTHPGWFPKGTVLAVNIAHSNGYTAVCATVSGDPTRITVTNDQAVVGEIAIFDSDWKLIYGPYTVPELAWLPRVEPMLADESTPGFLFLGLYDPSPSAPDDSGLRKGFLSMYGVYVSTGTLEAPSPVLIDANVLGAGVAWEDAVTDFKHVWYDTHSRDTDRVFITYWQDAGDSTDAALVGGYINTSVTCTANILVVAAISTITSVACWFDELTNTFLVYDMTTKNFHVNDKDLGTPSTVLGPSAPNDIPVFYEDNSQNLNLTNYPISLVGSDPASPVTLSPETTTPPLHRRPMPHTGYRWLFTRLKTTERLTVGDVAPYLYLNEDTPDSVTGTQELEVLQEDTAAEVDRLHTVVPLNNTRQPWRVRDNWHGLYAGNSEDISPPTSHVAGTVGQAARSGTHTYLIPQMISVPVYIADDRVKTPEPVADENGFIAGSGIGVYTTLSEHSRSMAGVNSFWTDQTYIVVNEILTENLVSSSVGLNGSTLIAAGNLHVYDGQCSFEPCPELPNIYARSSEISDTDQVLAAPGWGATFLATTEGVEWRCILVYTDINGVKYRSDVVNTAYEEPPGNGYYTPLFEIDLLPSHLPQMHAGNGWRLEVYRSDVYTVDTGVPPYQTPTAGHKYVGTLPITWDSTNERWIADGANLRVGETAGVEAPVALEVETLVSPYTEGELPNVRPPSLSVLARAGQYIFATAYENNYEIWHTKPLTDFIGPEFNPNLLMYAPSESGGVVSLAGVGDRLLVLCKNGVWELFVGSGPDAAGGGGFPPFRKLWSGDGCVTHKWTISDTPFGVLFLSKSGPKLINAEGQVTDIGVKVDGLYDTSLAKCAIYDPITKEAWFFHEDSETVGTLVYDLEMNEWTTSTFTADTVFLYQDAISRLNGTRLTVHSEAATQDDGEAFYGKITTPWLTLNSTQGYFRVKRIASLLRHLAGTVGTLNIDLEYDYVDGVVDTYQWTATTFLTLDRGMQFRVKPGTQKVDAVRITIRDSNQLVDEQINTNTLRWVLAGITLYTEQKRGEVKLQQGASL